MDVAVLRQVVLHVLLVYGCVVVVLLFLFFIVRSVRHFLFSSLLFSLDSLFSFLFVEINFNFQFLFPVDCWRVDSTDGCGCGWIRVQTGTKLSCSSINTNIDNKRGRQKQGVTERTAKGLQRCKEGGWDGRLSEKIVFVFLS